MPAGPLALTIAGALALSAGTLAIAGAQPAAAPASQTAPAALPIPFVVGEGDHRFDSATVTKGLIAVHFLLKTECPYCMKHTRDYARRSAEVAGVRHIFLKPDDAAAVDAWRTQAVGGEPAIDIYRDADAALATGFGIPDGYSFHGETVHFPATVVIDAATGKELFRHVGTSNADRLAFDDFAKKVAAATVDAATTQGHAEKGLAVKGYDVVSYADGKPEKGKDTITSKHRGVTYRFASEARRDRFAANPEQFAPAYGGWCATAIADGDKVDIEPTNYKVTNGRLFLFYKGLLGNAKKDWDKKEATLTPKADAEWTKITASRK